MFRRRPGKSEQNDASAYSRRSAVADSAWAAQDRVRDGLDRASFPVEKKLVWPLQDRAHGLGAPARAGAFALAIVLAAAVGVAGLVWAAPDRPDNSGEVAVAAAPAAAVEVKATPAPKRPQPTLHGAAPVFKPAAAETSGAVDPAKAIVKSAPAAAADASPAAASSAASTSSAKPSEKARPLEGPPAGPAAVAVARDFSDAFVVYETGGLDAKVRRTFGTTATPELARALLRRPPRLPANVEVPRAKVLNVVAGPSNDGVYAVSVSLLRVGVTSELRLDMEQLKGKEWRVTNVLG